MSARLRHLSACGPWAILEVTDWPYQLAGVFNDGRPFLLRERYGNLTLRVAPDGFPIQVDRWPFFPDPVVCEPEHGSCTDDDAVSVLRLWLGSSSRRPAAG